ncbi:hypothetical protein QBC36DRAFT_325004 [Triangularia setosa]|uniref:Transmembrane protein n=1 Tax=Triangularia setosa TaxID=2587417 RepID=A0AAN7AAF6_9PEZI|nr:hypothetical protein QBC36DRAFT_325004 [Podospora setosa]
MTGQQQQHCGRGRVSDSGMSREMYMSPRHHSHARSCFGPVDFICLCTIFLAVHFFAFLAYRKVNFFIIFFLGYYQYPIFFSIPFSLGLDMHLARGALLVAGARRELFYILGLLHLGIFEKRGGRKEERGKNKRFVRLGLG